MQKKGLSKKIISFILVVSFIGNGFLLALPQKAQALDLGGSASIIGAAAGCSGSFITGGIFGKIKGSVSSVGGKNVPTSDSKQQEKTEAIKTKETCLDKIGYIMAKILLKKITQSTVAWINSGFNGNPTFIQNPGSFFGSIANEELTKIVGPLADLKNKNIYPWGKDIARQLLLSTQAQFEQNAKYSLDKAIGGTAAIKFETDFSAGGWSGWFNQTLLPQNNPIGSTFQASDEVTFRLSGTVDSPANFLRDELLQGQGFLGLKVCVDPENYDPDGKIPCKRYETNTPGEVLANKLDINLGTSEHQLELADSINESLAAVFDALASQLLNKGLASLSGSDNSNVGVFDGPGINAQVNATTDVTVQNPDQWYNQNPTFNIWHDIQPLIDMQVQYRNLLSDHYTPEVGATHAYPYTDPQGVVHTGQNYIILQQVLPAIYELDFCVPGPNPLWQEHAQDRIDLLSDAFPSSTSVGSTETIDTIHGILDPAGTTDMFSGIFNNIFGIGGYSEEQKLDHIMSTIFLQGLNLHIHSSMGSVNNPTKAQIVLNRIYSEYKKRMSDRFNITLLPGEAYPLYTEYKKVPGYVNAIGENEDTIDLLSSLIRRLQFIRDKMKSIPESSPGSGEPLNPADAIQIKTYLRSMGRIAPDLADDSTILAAEEDISTLIDTYNYLAEPGPNGGLISQCQDELRTGQFDDVVTFTGVHVNMKSMRFPYPTDLLPQSVQNIYRYDATLGGVMDETWTMDLNNPQNGRLFIQGQPNRLTPTYMPNTYYGYQWNNGGGVKNPTTQLTTWAQGDTNTVTPDPGKDYLMIDDQYNALNNLVYIIDAETNLAEFEHFLQIY